MTISVNLSTVLEKRGYCINGIIASPETSTLIILRSQLWSSIFLWNKLEPDFIPDGSDLLYTCLYTSRLFKYSYKVNETYQRMVSPQLKGRLICGPWKLNQHIETLKSDTIYGWDTMSWHVKYQRRFNNWAAVGEPAHFYASNMTSLEQTH